VARTPGGAIHAAYVVPWRLEVRTDDLLTWAEIDLDAIAANAASLKASAGSKAALMATVKANAYGHGLVPVASTAVQGGATWLAVHRPIEGIHLRQAGLACPILITGYTLPSESDEIVQWELTPTVNSRPQALALSAAAVAHIHSRASGDSGKAAPRPTSLPVHVKVDTGMGRYGLLPDEVLDYVMFLRELPGLALEGLYTHFSVADHADKGYTLHQFDVFMGVVEQLERAGIRVPVKHAANSATTLDLPEMALDLVRCGIALYGLHPSDEVEPAVPLIPVLSLKSRVARVRTLPAGASISYGRTYITDRPTLVALIPVGYGDGYHRILSNRGEVLVGGQRAPILGRVCMDQFVVDVSGIPEVQLHDEVVLIGRQGEDEITAEEVATWAETINYEITTCLLPRVARIYLKQGREVLRICC
jgi:alanine racemase